MKQCEASCHRLVDEAMHFTDSETQSDSNEKWSLPLNLNLKDEKVKEKKKGKVTLGYFKY